MKKHERPPYLITDDDRHAVDVGSSSFHWTCMVCGANNGPSTAVRVFEPHQTGWRRVGLVCCHHPQEELETFLNQRQISHDS